MMRAIDLTQGYQALVNDYDYGYLSCYRWSVTLGEKRKTAYAINNTIFELMHVTIMKHHGLYVAGMIADHKDKNGLNNQLHNLRMATKSQNGANSGIRTNNTSGYKGVYWNGRVWIARIMVNYEGKYLGSFSNKHDAAFVYNCWALHYFKEFAFLNEINRDLD